MKPWREVVPPGPIYAEPLNALAAEVRRLSKLDVDGGDVEDGPGGRLLRIPQSPPRHRVRVYADFDSFTGSGFGGSGSGDECDRVTYRWVRQVPNRCGEWVDETPIALTGSTANHNPAYETNGIEVADGSLVEITRGIAYVSGSNVVQEWTFDGGAAGGGPDGGFYAMLMGLPDGTGESDVARPDLCGSGSGAGDPTPPVWGSPERLCQGYAWLPAVTDGCGNWHPHGLGGGGTCHSQAFEANGYVPPGFRAGVVVWMRPAPYAEDIIFAYRQRGEEPPPRYVFHYPPIPPSGAGGVCGPGDPAGTLEQSVTIQGTMVDADGNCCEATVTIAGAYAVRVCRAGCDPGSGG